MLCVVSEHLGGEVEPLEITRADDLLIRHYEVNVVSQCLG